MAVNHKSEFCVEFVKYKSRGITWHVHIIIIA